MTKKIEGNKFIGKSRGIKIIRWNPVKLLEDAVNKRNTFLENIGKGGVICENI